MFRRIAGRGRRSDGPAAPSAPAVAPGGCDIRRDCRPPTVASEDALATQRPGHTWRCLRMMQSDRQIRCAPGSAHRQHEVSHLRVNLLFPFAAGEQAVMADAGLEMMALQMRAQARAEFMRDRCLADRADI